MRATGQFVATLVLSAVVFVSINVIAGSRGLTPPPAESASSAFERLDTAKRGYLTQEDVRRVVGFDPACDRNADGRITRAEFSPCWDRLVAESRESGSVGSTGGLDDDVGNEPAGTSPDESVR